MNVHALTDLAIRGSPGSGPAVAETPAPRPVTDAPARERREPEPTQEQVTQATEGVNAFLKASSSHVQFTLHEDSGRMMVEVIDDSTSEVIRTIPSKEILDLAAKIGELVGTLLDKKG